MTTTPTTVPEGQGDGSLLEWAIVSVDDHVLEPPDLWSSRLPHEVLDRGPRLVREKGFVLGHRDVAWRPDPDGEWADVWYYDGVVKPLTATYAAAGKDRSQLDYTVTTYDDVRPGCWQQGARLADMDLDHTEASICFPNTLPRFCGQTFAERDDKDLALLCVRAYNDWVIDEWCAGAGRGRLIPLTIIPLWDVALAVAEVERCAAKGSHAVTFTENPESLGLPSLYSREWDPFFAACQATETTICIHVGSSSRSATTGPDAPPVVASTLTFQYGMHSLIDVIFSGVVLRFPHLKIAYSECNVGWMPYVLERMDKIWRDRGEHTAFGATGLPAPPSSYLEDRIFGCLVDDESGLAARHAVGMGQICYETDYPHADSLFPNSARNVARLCREAGLVAEESYAFIRGNAIRAFGLDRFGIGR